MGWARGTFKDKDVWIEVDAGGAPVSAAGRTPMRYSDKPGAKVYRAGASGVKVEPGAEIRELDAGVSADAAKAAKKKSRGSGFGKAGTRTKQQAAMAADAAKALLAGLPDGTAVAYTDGACRGNPGPAGAGARVELPDGRVGEASKSLGRGTNNVGEVTAVGLALALLDNVDWPADGPVALLTDSSYAHGVLVKGWKAKANTELILEVRAALKLRPGVELHWVAGHVGIAGNERADALANAGVRGTTKAAWAGA
ncbi:MAG: ribonuclease HI [Myxococcota bacterium]|jgi:ribonuclease HI